MARKGAGPKGKQSEPSSLKGSTTHSRAARVAWKAEMRFKHLSTEKERQHVVGIEEVVRCQRHLTSDVDIAREVQYWVDDPKYTRTRETIYFQLEEMYWIVKAMVAQAVAKAKRDNDKTVQAIEILDGKFDLFCRSQFGIKFRVR